MRAKKDEQRVPLLDHSKQSPRASPATSQIESRHPPIINNSMPNDEIEEEDKFDKEEHDRLFKDAFGEASVLKPKS